jgi:hypothetical protein
MLSRGAVSIHNVEFVAYFLWSCYRFGLRLPVLFLLERMQQTEQSDLTTLGKDLNVNGRRLKDSYPPQCHAVFAALSHDPKKCDL